MEVRMGLQRIAHPGLLVMESKCVLLKAFGDVDAFSSLSSKVGDVVDEIFIASLYNFRSLPRESGRYICRTLF